MVATKYSLPDEPGLGTVVKDASGARWLHGGDGWVNPSDYTSPQLSWYDVLQFGPLELVATPKQFAVWRCNYDPDKYAVRFGEKWIAFQVTADKELVLCSWHGSKIDGELSETHVAENYSPR